MMVKVMAGTTTVEMTARRKNRSARQLLQTSQPHWEMPRVLGEVREQLESLAQEVQKPKHQTLRPTSQYLTGQEGSAKGRKNADWRTRQRFQTGRCNQQVAEGQLGETITQVEVSQAKKVQRQLSMMIARTDNAVR